MSVVGPVPQAEREAFLRRVKRGFALLVGLSGGLVALQGGGSPVAIVGATLLGTGVGAVLVRLAFPDRSELERGGRRFR